MAKPNRILKTPSEAGSLGACISVDAAFHDRKSSHENPNTSRTRDAKEGEEGEDGASTFFFAIGWSETTADVPMEEEMEDGLYHVSRVTSKCVTCHV